MPRKRQPKPEVNQVPVTFEPKFWLKVDQRSVAAREIRRRFNKLKRDAKVNSAQKELLAERAVFLAVLLESQEVDAAKTGKIEQGRYVQGVNALIGILKALGLEKQIDKVINLKTYVADKGNGR